MGSRPALRAVLFDAAGTLIRLREAVGETYTRLARAFGVSLSAAAVEEAFRHTFRRMAPMVFPGARSVALERQWWRELVWQTFRSADPAVAFADFEAYFDGLFRHYASGDAWLVAPGAHEALAALRARGLRTGVVSNFDHRLPGILADLGLAPLLDAIVRPADAGAAKPDARIFTLALQRLGASPRAAMYVGDDADHDLAGAAAAGLAAVDVRTLGNLLEIVARV